MTTTAMHHGMVRSQETHKVLDQRLADRDCLRCTVTKFKYMIEGDEP